MKKTPVALIWVSAENSIAVKTISDRQTLRRLQVFVSDQIGQAHVLLMGDLDPDCDVVIDIALLTFCDSTGLGVFVAGHKRLQANGHKLTIYAQHRACSVPFK